MTSWTAYHPRQTMEPFGIGRGGPFDVFGALLERRVVFLRGPLDDEAGNRVAAQLLLLARDNTDRAVELYVDSPGGQLAAALALHDVMHAVPVPVSTTCIGTAAGAAALVLASGASGKRFILPNARVTLRHDAAERLEGRAADVDTRVREIERLQARAQELLSALTGQPSQRIAQDLAHGAWLSAEEARAYGLVDQIVGQG